MYNVLIVVRISVLTTTGVAALWAGESPRHWFLRTVAFLAALAPLLLVPAYEPWVALALQGGTVAIGVQARRWWSKRRRSGAAPALAEGASRPQFSMATLLLSMVLCGVAAAVLARLPLLNWYSWQSVAVIGVGAGLATLSGRAAATTTGWKRLSAGIVACMFSSLVGRIVACFDWFADSFGDGTGWPPEPASSLPGFPGLFPNPQSMAILWIVVLPSVTLCTVLMCWATQAWRASRVLWTTILARAASVALAFVVAAPAAIVLYKLLTPEPIPAVVLPKPNAFDEFVAAGGSLSAALINSGNFDQDTASRGQVAKSAAEVAHAVERTRKAFQLRSQVPLNYSGISSSMSQIQNIRSLGRAFSVIGKLAALDRQPEEALAAHLDNVRLGFESRRGGLMIDGMVGCAVSGIGYWGLYDCREQFSPAQCREAIEQINRGLANSEPFEAFWRRDRVWSQHAHGWHGRLDQTLDDIAGGGLPAIIQALLPEGYEQPYNREQVQSRLLMAQLALDSFHAEHAAPPKAWEEVTHAGWPPLGADPYDSAGGNLRYKLGDEGPVIYSIGPNGVDDGGVPPADDDWSAAESGDLRSDRIFTN